MDGRAGSGCLLGEELPDNLHDAPTINREDALKGLSEDKEEGEE
jgi:hypothetical protein